MNDFEDERRYAWRMIRAARLAHAAGTREAARAVSRAELMDLLEEALDAGLDRGELIVELADLGARLLTLCNPESARADGAAIARELGGGLLAPAEICLT